MNTNKLDKISVVLVDDHVISGLGTKALLMGSDVVEIESVFNNASDVFHYLENFTVDVIITDILMPDIDGFSLLQHIKKINPKIKVLMLSISDDRDSVIKAMALGADGYLLKDIDKEDMIASIVKASNGEKAFSSKILNALIDDFIEFAKSSYHYGSKRILNSNQYQAPLKHTNSDVYDLLTDREIEILKFIGNGFSTKEIAVKLGISPFTVSTHRKNIYAKLGIEELSSMMRVAKSILNSEAVA